MPLEKNEMPLPRRLALVLIVTLTLLAGAAHAADLSAAPPAQVAPSSPADEGAPVSADEVTEATRAHLSRKAVLLGIRATFNVVDPGDIPRALAAELRRLGGRAPAAGERSLLDRQLLVEGGYYLTSLRYLVEVGGAAWPDDRPAAHYDNDALVRLDALEAELLEVVETGTDPLPVLLEAQRIHALTEGEVTVPSYLDRFSDRDALVESALAGSGPRTST